MEKEQKRPLTPSSLSALYCVDSAPRAGTIRRSAEATNVVVVQIKCPPAVVSAGFFLGVAISSTKN
jgi:hypothetical protein